MFVDELNEKEKSAFLGLVSQLITSDEVYSDSEKVIYSTLSGQCEGIKPAEGSAEELAGLLENHQSKVAALLELVAVAKVDNEYHEKEKDFINSVSEKMDIDTELLADIESWVSRQMLLTKEAVCLMEDK